MEGFEMMNLCNTIQDKNQIPMKMKNTNTLIVTYYEKT